MWSIYDEGRINELAALGTMLMVVLVITVLVAYRLGSRAGVRQVL